MGALEAVFGVGTKLDALGRPIERGIGNKAEYFIKQAEAAVAKLVTPAEPVAPAAPVAVAPVVSTNVTAAPPAGASLPQGATAPLANLNVQTSTTSTPPVPQVPVHNPDLPVPPPADPPGHVANPVVAEKIHEMEAEIAKLVKDL